MRPTVCAINAQKLYARMRRALDYTRQSRADSSQVVAKFRDRKRGGKLAHLFESWRLWLEWNTSINELGLCSAHTSH